MAIRKYFTEFGLNMFGTYKVLLQQDQLKSLNKNKDFKEYPCHIYMIARRPRIMFDPTSIKFTQTSFSGIFNIQRGLKLESHSFSVSNFVKSSRLQFKCPYPHTDFLIFDYKGNCMVRGNAAALITGFRDFWKLLSLEILYIGQSYGVEGARTAPERLVNHSTLQSIYSEAIRKSPDQDIWLLLWHFEPHLHISMDGKKAKEGELGTTREEDDAHTKKVIDTGITEQQQINFTEAALIRYFQPEYNIIYKDSFPNPAHKTYSECYDLDINSVFVELQTEDIRTQIWSPKAPAKWIHIAKYFLHSKEERKTMLDFFDEVSDYYDET